MGVQRPAPSRKSITMGVPC